MLIVKTSVARSIALLLSIRWETENNTKSSSSSTSLPLSSLSHSGGTYYWSINVFETTVRYFLDSEVSFTFLHVSHLSLYNIVMYKGMT